MFQIGKSQAKTHPKLSCTAMGTYGIAGLCSYSHMLCFGPATAQSRYLSDGIKVQILCSVSKNEATQQARIKWCVSRLGANWQMPSAMEVEKARNLNWFKPMPCILL